MITAERMAEIYWNRSGKFAAFEVSSFLRYFKDSPATTAYWKIVYERLQKRGK